MAVVIQKSANDFIRDALLILGQIDPIDPPEAEQSVDAFGVLNDFLEHMSLQRRLLFHLKSSRHPYASGVGMYPIGPGGAWNRERPMWIDFWSVIPQRYGPQNVVTADGEEVITSDGYNVQIGSGSNASESELNMKSPLSTVDWQRIQMKNISGSMPLELYYETAWYNGLGRVHLYPVPDNSNGDVVLYTPMQMQRFFDQTTKFTWPPGYARAIRYGFTVDLSIYYPGSLTDDIKDQAKEAIGWLKRVNFHPREADLDPGITGGSGSYDIYSDSRSR